MKRNFAKLFAVALAVVTFIGCTKETEKVLPTETMKQADKVIEVDVVTTASIVDNGEALLKALSADGAWIAAALNDIDLDKEIVVNGEFTHRDEIVRKLGLYNQDENHNITAQFTLTAPKMTVKSPNFNITGGTFKGDVYVEADGFSLDKSATVDGNIYFSTQAQMDSFTMVETAKLTGTKSIK